MPFVKFIENVTVNDRYKGTPKEVRFEAGKTYELPFESCMRWKKRGKAVDINAAEFTELMAKTDAKIPRPFKTVVVKPEVKLEKQDVKVTITATGGTPKPFETATMKIIEPVAAKPVSNDINIPDDWKALAWPKMKVLASRFSTEDVHNRPEAIKIIETELARRAG